MEIHRMDDWLSQTIKLKVTDDELTEEVIHELAG